MKKHTFILIVIAAYAAGTVLTMFQGEPRDDEKNSHLPLVKKFEKEFPSFDFIKNYSSASTPVPYIITSAAGQLVPNTISTLRGYNIALSAVTLFIFYKILLLLNIHFKYELALLLLFNPYFYKLSFLFYTTIWGMFFGFLSIYFFLKEKSNRNLMLAGIFSSLAVLSRQFWLFLPASFVIYLYFFSREKINPFSWSMLLLPQLLFGALFIYWKGFTSINYPSYTIEFKPMNFIFFFIFTGFYFWWTLLIGYNWDIKSNILPLILIPLFFIFTPVYTSYPSHEGISGIITHLSNIAGSILPGAGFVFLLIFFVIGILIINYLKFDILLLPLNRQSKEQYKNDLGDKNRFPLRNNLRLNINNLFLTMLFIFIMIMGFNEAASERYYAAGIPLLLILLSKEEKNKYLCWVISFFAVMSVLYLYLFLFLK